MARCWPYSVHFALQLVEDGLNVPNVYRHPTKLVNLSQHVARSEQLLAITKPTCRSAGRRPGEFVSIRTKIGRSRENVINRCMDITRVLRDSSRPHWLMTPFGSSTQLLSLRSATLSRLSGVTPKLQRNTCWDFADLAPRAFLIGPPAQLDGTDMPAQLS